MDKIILYHGSSYIIEKPEFGKGKDYNDYGKGFYCTQHLELAKEWACSENVDGYASCYELDRASLSILNLSSKEYTILNWLALLLDNRLTRITTPIAKRGKEYLLQNFLPPYEDYDIIIGYRADDSYFAFARAFLNNEISLKQLGYAMKLGKLGEQIVLKSSKAFDAIHFLDYTLADNSIYYAKRKAREEEARIAFQTELENEDLKDIFIRDFLHEEIKPNDPRLR